ncbi:hypothetical protein Tco_1319976 [Tanacetum coccineum]
MPLSRGSFDVIVGIDRLSKRKFMIVCHEKVVRIPLEGDEILRVHGERTQGVMKTLMNTKVVEFRIDLVHGATPVAKSPYRLAPSEMQELFEQLQELQDEGRVKLRRVRAMSMNIQSSVKDKILTTPSETSKVENAPAKMLRDLDEQMEKRADDGCTLWIKLYSKYEYEIHYHPGRANVVIDALRRKERVKPRREMMRTVVMDEAHASRFRWMIYLVVLADAAESVSDAIRFEAYVIDFGGSYQLSIWCAPFKALYGRKCRSPVIWAEIGGSSLIRPELVQEMTNKAVLVKEKPKAAGDRQKSYADNRRKPLEFEVGDWVMLKVSP